MSLQLHRRHRQGRRPYANANRETWIPQATGSRREGDMSTATKSPNGTEAQAEVTPDIRGFQIPRPQIREATLEIIGLSPLIQHRWSEKALAMLEGAQTGKAKEQKTARRPEEEARSAAYVMPGREGWDDGSEGKYVHPAPAFKHAFLYGIAQLDDVKKFPKTRATGWVFIKADPVLRFSEMLLRSDTGRIGQGTATMVYRPQFNEWSCDLEINYNANTITLEQICAIFDLGGTGGIGEWRPTSPKNKSGDFGRFRIAGVTG